MPGETMRSLRSAPSQADFDRRAIPVTLSGQLSGTEWYRLARTEFSKPFFASPGSRLTPLSRQFPCVYLAGVLETIVAEVWGDRFAAQRESGRPIYTISRSQASKWEYLRATPLPRDWKICDLTDADTRLAVGIDSATLHTTDLPIPQAWAECVARHPARFDGIRYRSRHTDDFCLVVWSRGDDAVPLDMRIGFEPWGGFCESEPAYSVAGKIGVRLSFIW